MRVLLALAAVLVVGALAGVLWLGYEHFAHDQRRGSTVLVLTLALLLGALSAAAVMLALAGAIHYVQQLASKSGQPEDQDQAAQSKGPTPLEALLAASEEHDRSASEGGSEPGALNEVLHLLREINENSLLTDEQKQMKLERVRNGERDASAERVEELIKQGDYHLAQRVCKEIIERFGQDATVEDLMKRIEHARKAAEAKDIAEVRRKASDLMSISAWDRAEELVAELQVKHPDSKQARQLSTLVTHERQTFEQQQRRRMYADIEKHISRRQWGQALEISRTLIERYESSTEAEAVRTKIETLEANAEIEERQALESQIKDLVKKRRFAEAAELARHVINAYPDSPQAGVLRNQLTRLEEKAKKA
jgi:hypothetical protein